MNKQRIVELLIKLDQLLDELHETYERATEALNNNDTQLYESLCSQIEKLLNQRKFTRQELRESVK